MLPKVKKNNLNNSRKTNSINIIFKRIDEIQATNKNMFHFSFKFAEYV